MLLTSGKRATDSFRAVPSTFSVVICCAAPVNAERTAGAPSPLAPTTVTFSTATSEESRSQTQPPSSNAAATSSATTTVREGRRRRGIVANRGALGSAVGQLGIRPFFAPESGSPALSADRFNGEIFAERADVAGAKDEADISATQASLELLPGASEIRYPKHLTAACGVGRSRSD